MDHHFFAQTQTNGVRHKGAFTRMTGSNKSESKQKDGPREGKKVDGNSFLCEVEFNLIIVRGQSSSNWMYILEMEWVRCS
ncbi:hypothetical protein CEXT_469491 [Caerostris extrusa]|uniref:Uncharacterized protein n=1 Tax=Caerostris extrusa TaxID=172846 RepID=A0AAV4P9S1_CAEEX|nr:hypothetical protein CEXT_469491 [Caerostris extrusa]